jgi:L-ascorbate metabolism protein UlaG (beta-lactamase superfamily)
MKIHHLRSATFVIAFDDNALLVDPMLGKKGSIEAYTSVRFKPIKNPLVALPPNSKAILEKVTHCLITHLHSDHLDNEGVRFLRQKNIPVICSINDEQALKAKGLSIYQALTYWKEEFFLGGKITGIPAIHGYGAIAKEMGNVMGFYLELPKEKSIYISSDTIYTEDVHKILMDFSPDVAVLACGSAQLDAGEPILMKMQELIQFIKNAPGKVLANHLEALNHCPTTREQLQKEVNKNHLQHKVVIPKDGETINF